MYGHYSSYRERSITPYAFSHNRCCTGFMYFLNIGFKLRYTETMYEIQRAVENDEIRCLNLVQYDFFSRRENRYYGVQQCQKNTQKKRILSGNQKNVLSQCFSTLRYKIVIISFHQSLKNRSSENNSKQKVLKYLNA